MSEIIWTEDALAKVHVGRGVGEVPELTIKVGPSWRALKKNFQQRLSYWNSDFAGEAVELARVAAMNAALRESKPPEKMDVHEQAWLFTMAAATSSLSSRPKKPRSDKAVDVWVGTAGYPFAIRALVQSWGAGVRGGSTRYANNSRLLEAVGGSLSFAPPNSYSMSFIDWDNGRMMVGWRHLRALLAAADDADYTAARDAAAALRETSPLSIRCGLTYLFPTEQDWARADTEAVLSIADKDERHSWYYSSILASLADPELAARLIDTLPDRGAANRGIDPMLQTMVMRHGMDVLPLLEALTALREGPCRSSKEAIVNALMLLPAERAAPSILLLADFIRLKWLPVVKTYCADHHTVCLPLLRALPEDAVRDALLEHVLAVHPEDSGDSAAQEDLPECLRGKASDETLGNPLWNPAQLPDVRLRGSEKTLASDAMGRLMESLMTLDGKSSAWVERNVSTSDIQLIHAALEPDDLRAFTWAFFEVSFPLKGWSKPQPWALYSLAPFANDDTVSRLIPYIEGWPRRSWFAHSVKGLEVLRSVGTDAALMHLLKLSEKAKSKGLRGMAAQTLQSIAKDRNLTADQLGDRLVTTSELGPGGVLVLDFGPRKFTVGFDEHLTPFVLDDAGKRRKSLPKPNTTDDSELSGAAVQTWKALKKTVKGAARIQIARLERFMVEGRQWPVSEFRSYLVEHPLMIHLVRRLVWSAADGGATVSFRVDTSGTFSSDTDEPVALSPEALVSVSHPIQLGQEAIKRWAGVFADYELIQPFEQLNREVFVAGSKDAAALVARVEGAKVKNGSLRGLMARGWERGPVEDAGFFYSLRRSFPQGTITLKLVDGGLSASNPQFEEPESVLGPLVIPEGLAPLAYSELLLQIRGVIG